MWLAMHDRPLTITGTGDETRDFAYVEDIVEGVLRMGVIDAAIGEAINLYRNYRYALRLDIAKYYPSLQIKTACQYLSFSKPVHPTICQPFEHNFSIGTRDTDD